MNEFDAEILNWGRRRATRFEFDGGAFEWAKQAKERSGFPLFEKVSDAIVGPGRGGLSLLRWPRLVVAAQREKEGARDVCALRQTASRLR